MFPFGHLPLVRKEHLYGVKCKSSEDGFQVYWATWKKPFLPGRGWTVWYGVGWVGIRGGTKKEKEGGSEKEKRDKAGGGGRGEIKREERGWFSWGGAAAEWRGWSSLFIDFRSALVARTCIRGLDALFVPPQRFSFTLNLPRSLSFSE